MNTAARTSERVTSQALEALVVVMMPLPLAAHAHIRRRVRQGIDEVRHRFEARPPSWPQSSPRPSSAKDSTAFREKGTLSPLAGWDTIIQQQSYI